MTNERTTATYSDADIQAVIETYPLTDADGFAPDQDNWTATYDLNAAAAEIWDEKGAAIAHLHDFSADGGTYHRSQTVEQYAQMARKYRSRRSFKSVEMEPAPREDDELSTEEV